MSIVKILLTVAFVTAIWSFSILGQTDCKVTTEKDKFTDKVSIYTPITSGLKASPVVLVKTIQNKDTNYYAMFHLYGSSNSYSAKGAYIIFEDGEKWIKDDADVSVKYVTSGIYLYQSIVTLNESDVERLIKHRVTDLKLYNSQIEVKDRNSDNFICAAKKVVAQ